MGPAHGAHEPKPRVAASFGLTIPSKDNQNNEGVKSTLGNSGTSIRRAGGAKLDNDIIERRRSRVTYVSS